MMPRIIRGPEQTERGTRYPNLVAELAAELEQSRACGQPVIHEQRFPRTGKASVTVLWDKWDDVAHEERARIILDAYEKAEGKDARENVALAVGWTFPEAYEAGMLPYQVIPLLRKGDPVSADDCLRAMLEEGASGLFADGKPELRFASEDEATKCITRLVSRLPASAPVWAVVKEAGRIEPATAIE